MTIPTFDIECVGWTTPIAVGFFDGYKYHEFIREDEEDDPIWKFLCHLKNHYMGVKLYAHCASKFDNKFILSSLCHHGEIIQLEAGLIRLRWKEPNIYFEDSYPLLPMTLKKINKMFQVEEKGDWDHEAGLKPWEMGEDLTTFKDYLRNDCISLSHSLEKLCESLGSTFGITPSISLATTSAKAFSKGFYDINKIEPNETFERFIREATYGGRNEVYKRYGEDIHMYDIRSMFVSCYDTPVPIEKLRWIRPNLDAGTLAEASVKVPKDTYIGPLPLKYRDRLVFPVGEFQGWWTTRELRNAVEHGVDVKILRQLYCEEEPVLKGFGEYVSKLRTGREAELWKMFGLALSGKLGQGRWKDVIRYVGDIENFRGYTPLDKDELYFQIKEYLGGKAPYIRPAISMAVRSEARVRHYNKLIKASKKGDVFYGDTDSLFTTTKMPIGERVGNLSYLGKASRGYFIRQKLYAIIEEGQLKQRSAGYSDLRLSEEDFQKLLRGDNILQEVDELPTFTSILKGRDLELINRARLIRGDESLSRIPIGIDTKPICLP